MQKMKPINFYRVLLCMLVFLFWSNAVEACRWPHLFCHRDKGSTSNSECIDTGVSEPIGQPECFYLVLRINDAGASVYEGDFDTFPEAAERYCSLQRKGQSSVIWQIPK
jgi:hypothetical protein